MGQGCTKLPVQQAVNNPDDQLETVIAIKDGCAPAGSGVGYLGKYIPQNGEYEWAGEGASCYYCSLDAPNSVNCSAGCADVSCCAIIGTAGTYKRTSYKADPVQCCLQGVPTIDNLTCDPNYRNPKSQTCYDALKEHCIQGDRIFTEDVCKTWCANNLEECTLYKTQICNAPANFNNGYCKDWCLQNFGLCDASATAYCDADTSGDTFCNCLKSDLLKYKYNPLCEDKACIEHGYATSSMMNSRGEGCQIVDCNTYLNVTAGGKVQFQDVNIQQRCGSQSQSPSPTGPDEKPTSLAGKAQVYYTSHKLLVWTIIALIVWFIFIIIVMFI